MQTTSNALCSITKEADVQKKVCCATQKKVVRLQESQVLNEADIYKLLEEADFSELSYNLESKDKDSQSSMLITKHGKQFIPAIRKFYYSLLANQVPASNIE